MTARPRRMPLRALLLVLLLSLAAACADTTATADATGSSTATADADADASGSSTATATATATADADPADGAAADEVVIAHAQGETTVPTDPETVVVFDLGALDMLDWAGAPIAGVPDVPNLPEHLAQYAGEEYAKVGTLFEPDYEAVNALEPDLIVVAARSSTVYPELSELAPTIDLTTDDDDFLGSIERNLEIIGEIHGVQDRVADALADVDAAIAAVNDKAAEAGTGLIVLTTGGEVSAYGPGSRFGIIHDLLGVAPAVEDVEAATHGDAISWEFIAEANPDHLFVLDRDATIGEDGEAASVMLDNEIVHQTTAWANGDVHYLDGVNWYLVPSGLRSVQAMIGEIDAALS
ncbi:siderophore ABC transporter substrate-binding protein [Euzebya rosea]|uniref:siderophore ABC transporter substrate-binding protein n=1 Tax=Euzebya rosea TaxID=2052804 RepID=UPI00196A8254|nr:ABC transporter substrate-binding protein [Euzebya rosea]